MEPSKKNQSPESSFKGTVLKKIESDLRALMMPQARISFYPKQQSAIGTTRFGGTPDLPKSRTWPVRETIDRKVAYSFLGQINCADINQHILKEYQFPSKGMLYFFLDDDIDNPEDFDPEITDWDKRTSFRVLYTDNADLVSLSAPQNIPANRSFDYNPKGVTMTYGQSVPLWMPDEMKELLLQKGISIEEAADEYQTLFETLQKGEPDQSLGRMFGYAEWQQEPEELTCELMREQMMEEAGESDTPSHSLPRWFLLLQYCDERYGEKIYFMIRSDDLAASRFDRCWMIRQST